MKKRKSFDLRQCSLLVLSAVLLQLVTLFIIPSSPASAATLVDENRRVGTYTNPLSIYTPSGARVESCADPSIIRSQTPGDSAWYIYCTTDPLNSNDKTNNNFNFHLIPMHKSYDLVHWTYVGDAFTTHPAWTDPNQGLWAPDIHFFNGQYYLYYTAPGTTLPGGASAIGVATGPTPVGPWTDSGGPVVEPNGQWTFDPAVMEDNGQKYIFYGSFYGGVKARKLSADGLHSDPSSQIQIAIPNRYEGSYIVKHDGYFYFFGSATNCCNGPLTGYSVFAGRSKSITGPYIDQLGHSLLDARVGGTPVISMNGNRWVGTGHNAVFRDFDGQDWFLYHAVDRYDPYFAGTATPTSNGFTKRPVLMDRLDWVNGWPSVRAGQWASDTPQKAPAAQPGQKSKQYDRPVKPLELGDEISALSDEFNSSMLNPNWSWVRQPAPGTYGLGDGTFRFDTQNADLYVDSNNASVLTEPTPRGDYVVETKFSLNLPPEGCCFNFVQAGMVIYGDDDNFIKLVHFSNFETRQTEFAKELKPVPPGYPRYGNTVVGPPGDSTYLRIAKHTEKSGEELYTAYTSTDGINWVHGGTWTHHLGSSAKIGLVSMGGSGFTAKFDYVRVYRLGDSDDSND